MNVNKEPHRRSVWNTAGFVVVVLIALGFLAFGVYLAGIGLVDAWRGMASRNWPSAEGKIVNLSITEVDSRHAPWMRPDLEYDYRVNGKDYRGDMWRFDAGYPFCGYDETYGAARRYTNAGAVEIHYRPGNPSISVLEPGFRLAIFLPLLGGVFLIAIAFLFVRYAKGHYADIPRPRIHLMRFGKRE
jgi:hypothetical protein